MQNQRPNSGGPKSASIAKSFGIEAHMITPREAKEIYPPLDPTAIQGAIYIPNDGQTNPVDTTMALIAGRGSTEQPLSIVAK